MLVKLAFVMQRLKKYLKKIFVMTNIDGGGTILRFYGGDIELMAIPPVPPPTRENPAGVDSRSKVIVGSECLGSRNLPSSIL